MNKTLPTLGRAATFLAAASVVMDGRPGRVTKADTKTFTVEFPEQWLEIGADDSVKECAVRPAPEAPQELFSRRFPTPETRSTR